MRVCDPSAGGVNEQAREAIADRRKGREREAYVSTTHRSDHDRHGGHRHGAGDDRDRRSDRARDHDRNRDRDSERQRDADRRAPDRER